MQKRPTRKVTETIGQGFNDARGEVPDQEPIPAHNGLNVNNDPSHHRANEKKPVSPR